MTEFKTANERGVRAWWILRRAGYRIVAAVSVMIGAAAISPDASGTPTSPQAALQFMNSLSAQMSSVLNAKGATGFQREQGIRKILDENFDIPLIVLRFAAPKTHTSLRPLHHRRCIASELGARTNQSTISDPRRNRRYIPSVNIPLA